MTSTNPFFLLENASLLRDETYLLRDVNWETLPGQNWVILGPNGAGKSTLLQIVLGYIYPTDGRATILGTTLGEGAAVHELRARLPIVSESLKSLINPDLTGEETLVTGLRSHLNLFAPITPAERSIVEELVEMLNLQSLAAKTFGKMSTGEKQRVLLGRSLTRKPDGLILDEPCAGLDLGGREWLLQTLGEITCQPDAPAIYLVTHHVEEIISEFTHLLLMKAGEVHYEGPIKEGLTSANLSQVFDLPIELGRQNERYLAMATK